MASRKMRIKLLVKDIATNKNITRAKLARMSDVTYETMFKLWADEYRDVSLQTLVKVSLALHVPITDLYTIVNDDTERV